VQRCAVSGRCFGNVYMAVVGKCSLLPLTHHSRLQRCICSISSIVAGRMQTMLASQCGVAAMQAQTGTGTIVSSCCGGDLRAQFSVTDV
jgi:hypothetical protein